MKISKVVATPIILNLTRPAATSMGSGSAVTRTIIEVHTDSGITGLGETAGAYAARFIRERIARKVVGLDPLERQAIARACVPAILDYGTVEQPAQLAAFAGIEIALWDIAGQAMGIPVYQLLGGACRNQALFVAYLFSVEQVQDAPHTSVPETMAALARTELASTGASLLEFKVARHDVDTDIETVLAIRQAVGNGIEIGVDANMRYSLSQARRFLDATRTARLCNIEEPCATLSECDVIGRDFAISVSTHCVDFDAVRDFTNIDGLVGAVDAQGGLGRTLELASGAVALRRRYWLRSCVEGGIGWAAMVHLGMACPAMSRPSQALIQWIEDDLILGSTWRVAKGGVVAPMLPGLGVQLDRLAFEVAADRFARDGEKSYFDKA